MSKANEVEATLEMSREDLAAVGYYMACSAHDWPAHTARLAGALLTGLIQPLSRDGVDVVRVTFARPSPYPESEAGR